MRIDEIQAEELRLEAERKAKARTQRSHSPFSERAAVVMAGIVDRVDISSPAPQGIGENKHAAVDENRGDSPGENDIQIAQVLEAVQPGPGENARRFRAHSLSRAQQIRRSMESIVRSAKWEGIPCPYCNERTYCKRIYIRCGDRAQFSSRESDAQQRLPHRCRYNPGNSGDHVLIVDRDPEMQQFCRNTLVLFLGHNRDKITVVDTGGKALAFMKNSKIEGRRVGLVIGNTNLPDFSGYELVNRLFDRNFTADIVLVDDSNVIIRRPEPYQGDRHIIPEKPFVGATLSTPFHSNELVEAIRELRFVREQ